MSDSKKIRELFGRCETPQVEEPTPGLDALRSLLAGMPGSGGVDALKPVGSQSVDRLRCRTGEKQHKGTVTKVKVPKQWEEQPALPSPDARNTEHVFDRSRRRAPRTAIRSVPPEPERERQRDLEKERAKRARMANPRGPTRRQSLDESGLVATVLSTPREYRVTNPRKMLPGLADPPKVPSVCFPTSPGATGNSIFGGNSEADCLDGERQASEPALAASIRVLENWMECFTKEEEDFDSLSVFFETRLREALVQTSAAGMAVPNRARAAACADLVVKLPRVLGRYAPLVGNLVHELLRCIYKDYDTLEADQRARNLPVDARFFFSKTTAFFDLSQALKKRAAVLQAELKESSEGAGLVKLFRERFLLWDGRNLCLRCILFNGWRKYARQMVAGRKRLRLMRAQYWFDRFWEGIELQREEAEGYSERIAKVMQQAHEQQHTEKDNDGNADDSNRGKKKDGDDDEGRGPKKARMSQSAFLRRSARETKRASSLFASVEMNFGGAVGNPQKASDLALKFMGRADRRADLLAALDGVACDRDPKMARDFLPAHEIATTLIKVMEDAGIALSPKLAQNACFVAGVAILSSTAADDPNDGKEWCPAPSRLAEDVDYVAWLGLGTSDYASIRIRGKKNTTTVRDALDPDKAALLEFVRGLPSRAGTSTNEEEEDSTKTESKETQTETNARASTDDGPTSSADERSDDGSEVEDDGRKKNRRRHKKQARSASTTLSSSPTTARPVESTSSVTVTSVCTLIPLVYDRLLEACDGGDSDASKVRLAEVAKHALVRRFGVKNIAFNYYQSLIRTTQLAADKETRIALFGMVFGVDAGPGHDGASSSSMNSSSKKTKKEMVAKKKGQSTVVKRAGVVSMFCSLWHTYFRALQVLENARGRANPKSRKKRQQASFHRDASERADGLTEFLQSPDASKGLEGAAVEEARNRLQKLPEFATAKAADVEALVRRTARYECAAGTTLVKQDDASQPPVLVLGLEGEIAVYVKTKALIDDAPRVLGDKNATTSTPTTTTPRGDCSTPRSEGGPAPGLELVTTISAPFVIGEGRLLTGALANATIVTTQPTAALACAPEAFEALLEANNTALGGLEMAVTQRAAERVRATGASVSRERVAVYRQFFAEVDSSRTGRISLSELLEGIQAHRAIKGVSTRDVERAIRAAGVVEKGELDFDAFVRVCDALVRRGKRLFDAGAPSDVLKDVRTSYVLYEAFKIALERSFAHAAMHEPGQFAQLLARVDALPKTHTKDPSSFLPGGGRSKSENRLGGGSSTCAHAHDPDKEAFVVVDADLAFLTALQAWQLEDVCKKRLAKIASARIVISVLVRRWLSRRRSKAAERIKWTQFLHDSPQSSATLQGTVAFDDFVDVVEEAYGAPVPDSAAEAVYEHFQDLTETLAATSCAAVDHARHALTQHIAALYIQLLLLRRSPDKSSPDAVAKRAKIVVLYIVANNILSLPGQLLAKQGIGVIITGLQVHIGARVAQFLLSARCPQVNADACFAAMHAYGLRLGAGRSRPAPAKTQPTTGTKKSGTKKSAAARKAHHHSSGGSTRKIRT